jgi:hypothetical protein
MERTGEDQIPIGEPMLAFELEMGGCIYDKKITPTGVIFT